VKFSERIGSVQVSGIRKMFEMGTADSINLGLGEPDFQPPEEAREALKDAVDAGKNKYGPTSGLPQLREAVAEHMHRYDRRIDASNALITASGTSGLMAIMQSFIDPGDEVLIPDPGFVLYHPHTVLAGGTPVAYTLAHENHFEPDVDEIQSLITPRTKAIILNSPSNPTGGAISEETFKALKDITLDRGILIISDEVYDSFQYEGIHHSFVTQLENSVVVNSFSKSLATTGWRIGYVISNPAFIETISRMQYYMIACPPTPIQQAVLEAMPHIDRFNSKVLPIFDRRRKVITDMLNDIPGFECVLPKGAFYAFPNFSQDMSSMDLATEILKAGVICSPGSAFGRRGEGHLRFSYSASEDAIVKGIGVVKKVVASL
jgi:aspartate/methionine/tyrosine aminotransferase